MNGRYDIDLVNLSQFGVGPLSFWSGIYYNGDYKRNDMKMTVFYRFSMKNVMLLALWYGPKKPDIIVFMRPTLDEVRKLTEEGKYLGSCTSFYNGRVLLEPYIN